MGLYSKKKVEGNKPRKPCRHQLQMQEMSTTTSRPSMSQNHNWERSHGDADPADEPVEASPLVEDPPQVSLSGPCQKCKKEKHDARVYRWKLIGGLVLPFFLASVDLTIVAASLPFIASHFDKLDQLNWIVNAFSLTAATFIPAYGQLADVFGRHPVLQCAVFFMLIGSVLCAAAQSFTMLLFGRALQGMGAAGINNLIEIILSDKVSLEDNSKNSTIFAMVGGLSFSIGPWVGGLLTDISWRYAFVLSIPVAVVAHIAIFFLLRKELVGGSHFTKGSRWSSFLPGLATVDIGGTILFIAGVALIIIGTSWGGATYSWSSPQVLCTLIIGSVLFVLFFVYEYLLAPGQVLSRTFPEQSPMVPWELFKKSDTTVLAVVEFATGAAMFSVFYFIGIYFTLVEEYSAGKSGTQLLMYLPGLAVGVYAAMYICNVWPAQTWYPMSFGSTIEAIGIGLITWAVAARNLTLVKVMMAVSGLGTGLRLMPPTLHAAGIFPDKIAPAMSVMQFAHPFGGTLALTIMGSVFNNKMSDIFNPMQGSGGELQFNPHSSQSLDAINDLPQEIQEHVRDVSKDAIMWAFVSIIPIMALSVIAVLFLGNVWIKSKKAEESLEAIQRAKTHDEGITSSEVIDDSFIWAVITRTVESKKYISTPLSKAEKEKQAQGIFEEKSRIRAARRNGRSELHSAPERGPFQV